MRIEQVGEQSGFRAVTDRIEHAEGDDHRGEDQQGLPVAISQKAG